MYTEHPVSKDNATFTTEESVAPSHSRRNYSSVIDEVITEEDSNSSDSSTVETFNQEERKLSKSLSNDSVFPPSQEEPRVPKRKCGRLHFTDIENHREAESEKYSNQPKESLRIKHHITDKKTKRKQILKKVSVYFNTGELVAIMGPSGCGKTTLLDLLTGRRKQENHQVCTTRNISFPGGRTSMLCHPPSPGDHALVETTPGLFGLLSKTLTLFMCKICDSPHPVYDLTKNSIAYL